MESLYKVITLIVLGALSRGQLPEDDFRIVNRQDLLALDSDLFEDNSTKSFSQLLFDVARDQLIVGARDTLYRLSLRGLRQLERTEWPAPPNIVKMCQVKGQSEEDCHNYIKVLLPYGHKLFACGTYAFSPLCSWREIESISTISELELGVAKCPCSPHSNVTSILATTGEYYAGTPTDFTSSDTTICRSRGASTRDLGTVRTTQFDLRWLNEPQFVSSFEDEHFVYFVFREYAVEYMNCGKAIYSRIARVCKYDSGISQVNNVGIWSTFLKARLICSVPGDVPFYYDEVQSVEYLAEEKILVATFTTNSNSIPGSAVCIYNMSEIQASFDGPYKVQQSRSSTWESLAPSARAKDIYRCVAEDDHKLYRRLDEPDYHLMYHPIEPISREPVYKETLQRFTHITTDITPTESGRQLVVYVATQNSDILKLAVLPRYDGACLVELLRLKDDKGGFDIQTMQFVKDTMSIYIGSDSGVLRVSGQRCSRHKSKSGCELAADPHCGWDEAADVCTHSTQTPPSTTLACTAHNTRVDGGWSSWSAWEPCMQDGTAQTAYGDHPDMCQCRTRRCDNPPPKHGGVTCQGPSISVSNCTVHGGWSSWSGWSECSASCGIAVKSRRRSCTAPEPKFGGRVCVGLDSQDLYCSNLPPCPDPALAPVDGGWSPWGPWTTCSSQGGPGCGPQAGWRERRRTCTNPSPKNGGVDCEGLKIERQQCDLKPCELRKASAWTPWVQIPSNTSDGSYTEKRFKFLCKAPSSEQIRLSVAREEERYCTTRGCSNSPPEEGWEAWGAWSECSAPCGGGQQARSRRCKRPPCSGSKDMLRACNTHACSGQWSCWSEWSECSDCEQGGVGHRTRTRMCLSPEGCADAGAALETKACVGVCGELENGLSEWSSWVSCENGERLRRRTCDSSVCTGALVQLARDDQSDDELYALPAYGPNVEMASFVIGSGQGMGVGGIVGCVIAAFLMGCLFCLIGMIYFKRRGASLPWGHRNRVPSSPHYITAKQNSYVTVPLKEVPRKAKRQPSFSGIGTSGILLKSNNISNANNHNNTVTTPKLYPKAIANEYDSMGTLRRHSNNPNHKNNLDIEEDKFY